jgi:tRNA A37 N6-isopentenylltransferase MiaA
MSREEAGDKIVAATRAYAKRQLTWLKRIPNLVPIEANLGKAPHAAGVEKLAKALGGGTIPG